MSDYIKADPEMVKLCNELIDEHHDMLDGVKIAIICKATASKKNGKTVLATAALVSKKWLPLLEDEYQFVITVPLDTWEILSKKQRAAVMDHELCHCIINYDSGNAEIRGHDLEEFGEIIHRHGFYRGDEGERSVGQALLFRQGPQASAPNLAKAQGE